VLPLDEPPMLPEPELLPVLGLVGLLGLVVLPELEPVLEPVLPEPVVLPEPDVLPYCLMQSSRGVPVRPTHWLGVAALSLLEALPVAPEEVEPELDPVEPLAPVPALPPTLGLVVELPLLPEVCDQDTVARPSRAAATAALSVFAITMYAPLVD